MSSKDARFLSCDHEDKDASVPSGRIRGKRSFRTSFGGKFGMKFGILVTGFG